LKLNNPLTFFNGIGIEPGIGIEISLLLILLTIAACSSKSGSQTDGTDNQVGRQISYQKPVTFINSKGDSLSTVDVAVADDESERNTGLMNINNLPEDKGMLFIFNDEKPRSFWMANTPLPLDIIFVDADSNIVRIHHSTRPYDETNYSSGKPAKFVVEVNAGYCVSHDILEGGRIAF